MALKKKNYYVNLYPAYGTTINIISGCARGMYIHALIAKSCPPFETWYQYGNMIRLE